MNSIKILFIATGLACGMTAAALTYLTQVDRCQRVIVADLYKQQQFKQQIAAVIPAQQVDFLTELSKKR